MKLPLMGKMNKTDKKHLKNHFPFVQLDQVNEVDKMNEDTLNMVNTMCQYAVKLYSWKHQINSSYREGDTGQHGDGRAIDMVFYKKIPGDIDIMRQFIFALRFNWGGVGFYPYWNTPGIHVDMRPFDYYRKLWWRDKKGRYHNGDMIEENVS